MNTLRALALAVATLSAPAAFAGEGHHDVSPRHNGVVVEVKDVVYELVATAGSLTLHIDDHGRKIDTTGASGKITLLNGAEKTEAVLSPAGDNQLAATGTFKVGPGSKAVAVVTLAGKAPATARFAIK